MKIQVTNRDLRDGKMMLPEKCPVALAISRQVGGRVSVGLWTLTIAGQDYHIPKYVSDKIAAFDKGGPVEPFCFNLADFQHSLKDKPCNETPPKGR